MKQLKIGYGENKNIHMKKIFVSCFVLLLYYIGLAQEPLLVQSNSKGLYLLHTVHPKDNFYSIGRLYNIPPKEIAAFNALDMAAGLSVGQSISIPLTASNFSQTKASGTPVYYEVGEKEGLYRVSVKNGNVLMASLRKWNHLANDAISAGQKMIVGYLQSTEAINNATVAKIETTPPPVLQTQPKEDAKVQPKSNAPQQQTPVQKTQPQEIKSTGTVTKPAVIAGGSGYFKNQFDLQSKATKAGRDATVTSGIFKTTSGWQDAKYYALMDKVEPGTIVQVVNPSNNKSIYAKVLGEMSGIRQNQGLELRISNAAATALDVNEPEKFIVRVVY